MRHLLVKSGTPGGVFGLCVRVLLLEKIAVSVVESLGYNCHQKNYQKYNYRTDKNSFQCGKSYYRQFLDNFTAV